MLMRLHLLYLLLLISPRTIFPTEGPLPFPEYAQAEMRPALADTAELNQMIGEAKRLYGKKENVAAMAIIRDAMKFAETKKITIPYTLYQIYAETALAMGDYGTAYKESEIAITLLKPTVMYRQYAEVALFRSKVLQSIGKFSSAIELLNQVAALASDKHLKGILPVVYRELSNIYNMSDDQANERKSLDMMLESSVAESDSEFISRAYFRKGEFILRRDSNIRESIRYFTEALRIRELRGDSSLFPTIINRIGWNHYLLKNYDSAMRWFRKCIVISEQQRNFAYLANSYGNIGTIRRDLKDYPGALENYGRSTAYSLNTKDWFNLSWVYKDMSDLYQAMGEYKKAYYSYVSYKQYSDSLKVQSYNTGLAEARARYQTEAKDKEVEVLALKLDRQRYLTFGFAALIILALLIGILLYRQSRLNNRRKISEMNRKIAEITQANLRQQMNPHFIFNTLNSIQYYMYQHDKIATNNYLTKFSSLMRKILENSRHTAVPIRDELDALQLYLELETLRFKDKFTYTIHIDEEIDTLLYKIPTMLIQPYVENAICHGLINREGNGRLTIEMELKGNFIVCTIEDNGIGREAAMEIKKAKNTNHNSLGTMITESRLTLANELYGHGMKVIYTDLTEKGRPAGTRVDLQIPVMT
jgi:tetratricopeptide (TPR) repeat protein